MSEEKNHNKKKRSWALPALGTATALVIIVLSLNALLTNESRQPKPKVHDLSSMDFSQDVEWESNPASTQPEGRTILLDSVTIKNKDQKEGNTYLITTPLGREKDRYAIIKIDRSNQLAADIASGKIRHGESIWVSLETATTELGPEKESLEKHFKKADFYNLKSWKNPR